MAIITYEHHDATVSVQQHLQGRHREHCLCWQKCLHFAPGKAHNCDIAQAPYQICVDCDVVTPVWECAKYERGAE